jgi:hypothetical protein
MVVLVVVDDVDIAIDGVCWCAVACCVVMTVAMVLGG